MDAVAELVRWVPAAALRAYVAEVSGYRWAGAPVGVHRGLPSPHLTLVITLDEPLLVLAHADPTQAPAAYDALLGGLHCAPALIEAPARQSGVQLSLTPLGARALLRRPAAELVSTDVPAAEVLGPAITELRERLQARSSWAGRAAVVDAWLLAHLDPDAAVPPVADAAWRVLLASGGTCAVSAVAEATGWGRRHLGAQLRAEVGLTPKVVARVVRFDRARRRLAGRVARGLAPDLADLAAATGYYDQAHLARDFRALAGLSPTAWLASEVASVQAERTGTPAGSTA